MHNECGAAAEKLPLCAQSGTEWSEQRELTAEALRRELTAEALRHNFNNA